MNVIKCVQTTLYECLRLHTIIFFPNSVRLLAGAISLRINQISILNLRSFSAELPLFNDCAYPLLLFNTVVPAMIRVLRRCAVRSLWRCTNISDFVLSMFFPNSVRLKLVQFFTHQSNINFKNLDPFLRNYLFSMIAHTRYCYLIP